MRWLRRKERSTEKEEVGACGAPTSLNEIGIYAKAPTPDTTLTPKAAASPTTMSRCLRERSGWGLKAPMRTTPLAKRQLAAMCITVRLMGTLRPPVRRMRLVKIRTVLMTYHAKTTATGARALSGILPRSLVPGVSSGGLSSSAAPRVAMGC